MRWYVDGMNVIGTRPDGWWRDRDAAMLRLVDLLERWAAAEGEDVVVVFERPPLAADPLDRDRGRPRAAATRDAADDEIIRRLRQSRTRRWCGSSPRTAGWPTRRAASAPPSTAPTCSARCSRAERY